jgi:CheY-like chemotaxis protein
VTSPAIRAGRARLVSSPDFRPVVLLADDDADDREMTAEAFAEAGIASELRMVHDGEALMDYLLGRGDYAGGAQAPVPSIILLDLNMPRKDGREVLADLKSDHALRGIPVVVLTTSRDRADVAASYDLGASSFITKPVSFAAFVTVLRDFARYWFETAELPGFSGGPGAGSAARRHR